jgi:ComF family protein
LPRATPVPGRASHPPHAPHSAHHAPWACLVAPYRYAFPVDHCVRALKFHGQLEYGRVLGTLIAEARRARGAPLPALVVPVPLHASRYRERGFNQAAVIARFAARGLGIPLASRALERVRATAEQSHLPAAARAVNVAGAFRASTPLVGQRVALVDDVLTTGSTATAAASALREAGAVEVELWVAARPGSGGVDAEGVIEQHADEESHPDVVVVQERTKTAGRLARADQPLLPRE